MAASKLAGGTTFMPSKARTARPHSPPPLAGNSFAPEESGGGPARSIAAAKEAAATAKETRTKSATTATPWAATDAACFASSKPVGSVPTRGALVETCDAGTTSRQDVTVVRVASVATEFSTPSRAKSAIRARAMARPTSSSRCSRPGPSAVARSAEPSPTCSSVMAGRGLPRTAEPREAERNGWGAGRVHQRHPRSRPATR